MSALKKERVEFRIPAEVKNTLEEAALLSNTSLSQFVAESAIARAETVIQENRRFQIDAEQWETVMSALENPREPTALMREIVEMSLEETWTVSSKK